MKVNTPKSAKQLHPLFPRQGLPLCVIGKANRHNGERVERQNFADEVSAPSDPSPAKRRMSPATSRASACNARSREAKRS